ncbi:MAG: hypothetical protein SGARI_001266, partial [Bacillariaceae sp.]
MSRCLREVGKLDQAIAILETLASCLEQTTDLEQEEETKHTNDSLNEKELNVADWPREQARVNCLWMLAVMTVEKSPDERGRQRALSLLHTSSLALQGILNSSDVMENSDIYKECRDWHRIVEDEALELFAPLEEVNIPKNWMPKSSRSKPSLSISTTSNPSGRRKKASWEVLTPMREQRAQQWSSPRKKRLAAVKAGPNAAANVKGVPLETESSEYNQAVVKL